MDLDKNRVSISLENRNSEFYPQQQQKKSNHSKKHPTKHVHN